MSAIAIPLLFGTIGLPEVLVILMLVIIIFGARKLPELGRGLGEGIRNFRKGLRADEKDASLQEPGNDETKQN